MAEKDPGEPIFPLGPRPAAKKDCLVTRLAEERTADYSDAKTQLVAAQVQFFHDNQYEEIAELLRPCLTYEECLAVFEPWPKIHEQLIRLQNHQAWVCKDTTWSWVTQFFYVAPSSIINKEIPLRVPDHVTYDFYCELCAKGGGWGGTTTKEQHSLTKLHLEHAYRFLNLYGNTEILPCEPKFSPLHGKYLLDIDEKITDESVGDEVVEPIAADAIPPGFDEAYRPEHNAGYVVLVINLNSEAKSVKACSQTLKLGPKLAKEPGRRKYALDFFSVHAAKRTAAFPVQRWRTLAFPVTHKCWVEIRVDGHVIHDVQLHPPAKQMVQEYVINESWNTHQHRNNWTCSYASSHSNYSGYSSDRKTCQTKKQWPVSLAHFLTNSYRHVRSGRPWPVQFLGEDNYVMSAVVYMTDPEPTASSKWGPSSNSWSKDNSWCAPSENAEHSSNDWKDANGWSSDWKKGKNYDKKDIIMYLHGDQYREVHQCNMPGIADFLWPTPDCGPIKFAQEKRELRGKILLHPCCPPDTYWFRHPNLHDAKAFNPQVASALKNLLGIACDNWNGDRSRFFITGLSMGGYGGLELAALWGPSVVRGALLACPSHDAIRQKYFAKRLRGLPIWVFHGRRDHLCKWEETASLMLLIKELGCKELRFSSTGCKDFDNHTDTGYCLENKVPYGWLMDR
eukprot:GEMP01011565.1.p1 GENE.GEMP01011565.1~~GEMP01011565.1.p1  ORF type:complete len:677 (+),score=101.32 GEMP01011565.1:84-2114(+)